MNKIYITLQTLLSVTNKRKTNLLIKPFLSVLMCCLSINSFAAKTYFPNTVSTYTGTGTYCSGATATALSFKYNTCNSGTGTATATTTTVKWYYNTTNSTTVAGATLVSTASSTTGTAATKTETYTPSTATTGTYYYFCVITWTAGACGAAGATLSSGTTQLVTVNASPGTVTGSTSLCAGGTTLTLSDATTGGTWSSSVTSVATVSPTTGTSTTVTSASAGSTVISYTLGTCSKTATVTVNPIPSFSVTPAATSICSGSSVVLTIPSPSPTILTENFNGTAPGWTVTNTAGTTGAGGSDWALQTPPIDAIDDDVTGDGSQVFAAVSDNYSAGVTTTYLYSPSFSTVGYSAASMAFNQYCDAGGDNNDDISYSTDGGTTWTLITSYTGTITGTTSWTAGVPTTTLTLPAGALGKPSVKLRFYYRATWEFSWSIDNVNITGTPIAYNATWTPTTALYTNPGLTTAYTGTATNTVYAAPTSTTTYTASYTSSGCTGYATSAISVNTLSASISGSTSICGGHTTTINFTGTAGALVYYDINGGPTTSITLNGSGNATLTTATLSTTTNYNLDSAHATGCGTVPLTGTATVNILPTPTTAVTPSSGTSCSGGGLSLLASGATSYTWLPAAGLSCTNCANPIATPSSATIYTVTGVTGTCTVTATANIITATTPTVSVSPTVSGFCPGGSATLVATAPTTPSSGTILTQNFNSGLGAWTVVDSEGTSDEWFQIVASGTATDYSSFTSIAGDGTSYLSANPEPDDYAMNTILYSPVFSTVGYSSATLSWNQSSYSDATYVDSTMEVDYSTDSGLTWTMIPTAQYSAWATGSTGTVSTGSDTWTAGTPNESYTLPTIALGKTKVKLRWYYKSFFGYDWVIDNISLTGAPITYTGVTWSPSSGLYTNPALTTAYTGGVTDTVYASPTSTTTFTASETGAGCTGTTSSLVNIFGAGTAPTSQPTGLTFSATTATGTNFTFTPNASSGYLVIASPSATLSSSPVNGVSYTTGATGGFGTGSIIISGSTGSTAPPYSTALLTSNTKYYFYIYAYNVSCASGDIYDLADAPLQNNVTTCVASPTLALGTVGTTTIGLSWTSITGGNAISPIPYTINVYSNSSLSASVGSYAGITGTSYTISGLVMGAQYWFTITAPGPCANVSNVVTATTNCGAASLPYLQTFEFGSTSNNLGPNCMQGNGYLDASDFTPEAGGEMSIQPNEFGFEADTYFPANHTVGGTWQYYMEGRAWGGNTDTWLVLPSFTLSPGTYNFSCYYATDYGFYGTGANYKWTGITAQYSTVGTLPSSTATAMGGTPVTIATAATISNTTYSKLSGTITITTAGTYYIGILGASKTFSSFLAIDDIEMCQVPTVAPTNDGPICASATDSVHLNANGTNTNGYVWTGPGTFSSTSSATPTVFGLVTPGTDVYTVTGYNDPASAFPMLPTGFTPACFISTPTTTVNVSPGLPTVTPSAIASVCNTGTGATATLPYSATNTPLTYNIVWTGSPTGFTNVTGIAVPNPISGNISVAIGAAATAGTYTGTMVVINGCGSSTLMPISITVGTPPTVFNVTPAATTGCTSSGVTIGLDNSQSGVNYQLYNGTATVGAAVAGTGSTISFGLQTASGTYTVKATSGSCSLVSMTGSVIINAVPNTYNVTPTTGSPFCSSAATAIGLNGSDAGVSYQLYNGTTAVGTAVAGSGAALALGSYTAPGTYSVQGTVAGCTTVVMTGSIVINAVPAAYNVTPTTGTYCTGTGTIIGLDNSATGVSYQLYNGATAVGTAVAGTGSSITFNGGVALITAGIYTVQATIAGCSATTMTGSVLINPAPSVYNVTPTTGSFCAGSGTVIGLDNSDAGVSYQLYNGAATVGSAVVSTGGAISFNGGVAITTAGTYTVIAAIAGCTSVTMTGSVVINPPAVAYNVTPTTGTYCTGTGTIIGLDNSATGVSYQLYNGATAVGSAVAGTGSAITFNGGSAITTAGIYTVLASVTGCTDVTMTGSVLINPAPSVYNVTPTTGSFCAGSGTIIGLDNSDAGVSYQLYNGAATVGSAVVSTGGAISFNGGVAITTAGTYTVVASIAGCTDVTMTGSVIINPPAVAYNVTPTTGTYCTGTGTIIGLDNSATGVSYQLYNGTTAVGSAVAGTGSAITFNGGSAITTAGIYTVLASVTGCTDVTMTGSVLINPAPSVYNVTPTTGSFCAGSGTIIGLDNSDAGVSYQLYNGAATVGSAVVSTGGAISFNGGVAITTAGTYTVVASIAGCTDVTMTGSVIINPPAVAYNITPTTGTYCTGTGTIIGLDNSATGVSYQLYNGAAAVGSAVAGTGSAITFNGGSAITTAGTYTVLASVAGCTDVTMTGSVLINPAPSVYNVTPTTGSFCAGSGTIIGVDNSDAGVSYQLYNGAATVGSAVVSTGGAISFNGGVAITTAGTYTVVASIAGCTDVIMTGSVVINPPAVAYNVTPTTGTYCTGTGTIIGLDNSATGVSYQLYNGTTAVGSAVAAPEVLLHSMVVVQSQLREFIQFLRQLPVAPM